MTKNNKPTKIVLAHINDTHSYFEPTSLQLSLKMNNHIIEPYVSAGGFARISTRFKQIEQDAQRQRLEPCFACWRLLRAPYTFHYLREKQTPIC